MPILLRTASEDATRLGAEAATIMQNIQGAHREIAEVAKVSFNKIAGTDERQVRATPSNDTVVTPARRAARCGADTNPKSWKLKVCTSFV